MNEDSNEEMNEEMNGRTNEEMNEQIKPAVAHKRAISARPRENGIWK